MEGWKGEHEGRERLRIQRDGENGLYVWGILHSTAHVQTPEPGV